MKFNAFIITEKCDSSRFNTTKSNLERAFPNFFTIICHPYVHIDDPRIDTLPLLHLKIASSNLISFLDIWTKEIPKRSTSNKYQWSFIFEDDVNFVNASAVSLSNFNEPLRELMINSDIRENDGFFYLGICHATFDNDSQPLISNKTTSQLISQKGCGLCRHATAITAKRAELFWTAVSSYRPDLDYPIDHPIQKYCIRSGVHFYTFGTNLHSPFDSLQRGVAYQDPRR